MERLSGIHDDDVAHEPKSGIAIVDKLSTVLRKASKTLVLEGTGDPYFQSSLFKNRKDVHSVCVDLLNLQLWHMAAKQPDSHQKVAAAKELYQR